VRSILLVALGGALGSVHHALDWKFPAGTFVVNVLGCLVAGVLAALAEKHDLLSAEARLFLVTGDLLIAASNVVLSVIAGLLALWLGLNLAAVKT
jgi:fluoride exporter